MNDLYHVRAPVAENRGARGTEREHGELDDSDAFENFGRMIDHAGNVPAGEVGRRPRSKTRDTLQWRAT